MVDRIKLTLPPHIDADDLYSVGVTGLLAACVLVLGLALWGTLHATKGCAQPARWAALCALGLLGVFGVEVVSLHGIDAVIYRQLGPIKVIGWLWLLWALPLGWMAWRR